MSTDSFPCTDEFSIVGDVRPKAMDPLTARAIAVWTGGDFLPIARSFAPGAAEFIARLNLRAGDSLLDVACGTGNLAIPAARAGARVTGVDIAPNLISHARREARAAGCTVTFDVGDAEALPYASGQFDNTVSMFGAMFAFRPDRAASELMRVTRPGGRIAMANWTPEGFVGEMLRTHVAIVPPPQGVPSSLQWGKEDMVRERFGDGITAITLTRRRIKLRFDLEPADVAELFATCYGPSVATIKATDAAGARQLRSELTRLFQQHNLATDSTTAVASEYLDVQARVA